MGFWNLFKSTPPAPAKSKKPETLKKREKKWKDPNEQEKYVCEAGKVMCPFCTPQIGGFAVTSNTISLQDRFYVTEGDNNGKINLDFKGVCTHPSQKTPPCKAVISTTQWKNTADTYINDNKALLVKSTIPCMISGQDIKVIHSGQKAVLAKVDPLIPPRPGHYYKEDGTFLGQISVSEDVYITDESSFNLLNKKKEVEESKIIAFTELYGLNNKAVLDRANWAYGEGGGAFVETYAQTIENLKNSGKSGYGSKPFDSETQMYQRTMLHGSPPKCLYPQYFTGAYNQPHAKSFADARKTKNQSGINNDPKKKAAIKAVMDSKRGLLANEGYNNWRGSGDTLYTEAEKKTYQQTSSNNKLPDGKLTKAQGGAVYATITTTIDHKWESTNGKYRRHSFYKIRRVNADGTTTKIEGIK